MRKSELHNYNSINSIKRSVKFRDDDAISQEETQSKVSNEGVKKNSIVQPKGFKGNTTFLIRLEENKKIIEENKRKAITSPKRFVTGKQSAADTSPTTKSLRSPKNEAKNAVTVNKIRRVTKNTQKPPKAQNNEATVKHKLSMDGNVARNNFRSPAAMRKNELLTNKKQEQEMLRNNISTARTSRRTREERK